MRRSVWMLILMVFLLCGCSLDMSEQTAVFSGWGPHIFSAREDSDSELADQLLETLTRSIEKSEESEITRLFAENIVANVPDWDAQVDALLDFWQGGGVSYHRQGLSTSETKENGLHQKEMIISYDIATAEANYRCGIKYCMTNTGEPGMVGIQSLYLVKAQDTDPGIAYWGSRIWNPGIVIE